MSRLAAACLLAVGLVVGCGDRNVRTDPVGGETHFLSACDPSAGAAACGAHLECLCNVCTAACDSANACPNVPGVQCLGASATCDSAGPARVCDVSCSSDDDCASLSDAHVCDHGFCRRATAAARENGGGLSCAAHSVSPSSVLIMGDALFAGTNDIGSELDALAQGAGTLAPGQRFEDVSSTTRNMLTLNGSGITEQYLTGNAAGDVRLVIMTGGGVDAIGTTCNPVNTECPVMLASALNVKNLLQQMEADGVEEVVYVFYPDPADAAQKLRIDVLRSVMQPVCDQSNLPCYFLDLRPVLAGETDYLVPDGLTAEGATATAQAIWKVMGSCVGP